MEEEKVEENTHVKIEGPEKNEIDNTNDANKDNNTKTIEDGKEQTQNTEE